MIGIVTDYAGKRTALPAFLQWSVKRTDGEPCDSFSVQFACGKKTASQLEGATEFQAMEAGKVVFTGIVDDFELRSEGTGHWPRSRGAAWREGSWTCRP